MLTSPVSMAGRDVPTAACSGYSNPRPPTTTIYGLRAMSLNPGSTPAGSLPWKNAALHTAPPHANSAIRSSAEAPVSPPPSQPDSGVRAIDYARTPPAAPPFTLGINTTSTTNDDLTVRGLAVGLAVGTLICFTNTFFGLQSGWITMASLQAALLGFGIFKAIPPAISHALFRDAPFTPAENTLVQATAVAVGGMPLSAGLVGIVPALGQLDPQRDGVSPIYFSPLQLALWCIALAYFGVFFASPLRGPIILKEKLRFPSGTATAQLISVLHRRPLATEPVAAEIAQTVKARLEDLSARRTPPPAPADVTAQPGYGATGTTAPLAQATTSQDAPSRTPGKEVPKAGWNALFASFGLSTVFTLASFFLPVLYAIPIFDMALAPLNHFQPVGLAKKWGWWFTPSFSYVGQGIIMGLPTTLSMTAGAFVGWAFLSPLATQCGWAKGDPLNGETGARAWIVWISLAIMSAESVLGLIALGAAHGWQDLKAWCTSEEAGYTRVPDRAEASPATQISGGSGTGSDEGSNRPAVALSVDEEHEPASRLVPPSWIVWGLLWSTVLCVVLIHWAFGPRGIAWWATVLAVILSSLLAILGVRALGETDLNPTSSIGKLVQVLFAVVQPGNVVANLIAGAIAEAGAMQAGDLLQDLKTGHLVGASPRTLFVGQMVGSTFGVLVSATAYLMYSSTYSIPGPEFPAPTAAVWLNLARLVNHGSLPPHAASFMVGSAAVFALTGATRTLARSKRAQLAKAQHSDPESSSQSDHSMPQWVEWSEYLPSGIAFSVGILNTPNFSLARLIGGAISSYAMARRRRAHAASGSLSTLDEALPGFTITVVTSGFVLGEGAASIANLLMKQAGFAPLTCFGCWGGCSGGC